MIENNNLYGARDEFPDEGFVMLTERDSYPLGDERKSFGRL